MSEQTPLTHVNDVIFADDDKRVAIYIVLENVEMDIDFGESLLCKRDLIQKLKALNPLIDWDGLRCVDLTDQFCGISGEIHGLLVYDCGEVASLINDQRGYDIYMRSCRLHGIMEPFNFYKTVWMGKVDYNKLGDPVIDSWGHTN